MNTLTLTKTKAQHYTSTGSFQSTYASLQAQKTTLMAQGKLQKAPMTDDFFTPEQEAEFNRGMTIDGIFEKYAI